jgi:hypothetical protein
VHARKVTLLCYIFLRKGHLGILWLGTKNSEHLLQENHISRSGTCNIILRFYMAVFFGTRRNEWCRKTTHTGWIEVSLYLSHPLSPKHSVQSCTDFLYHLTSNIGKLRMFSIKEKVHSSVQVNTVAVCICCGCLVPGMISVQLVQLQDSPIKQLYTLLWCCHCWKHLWNSYFSESLWCTDIFISWGWT